MTLNNCIEWLWSTSWSKVSQKHSTQLEKDGINFNRLPFMSVFLSVLLATIMETNRVWIPIYLVKIIIHFKQRKLGLACFEIGQHIPIKSDCICACLTEIHNSGDSFHWWGMVFCAKNTAKVGYLSPNGFIFIHSLLNKYFKAMRSSYWCAQFQFHN